MAALNIKRHFRNNKLTQNDQNMINTRNGVEQDAFRSTKIIIT